jgi:hypothetical protein
MISPSARERVRVLHKEVPTGRPVETEAVPSGGQDLKERR